MLALSRRKTLIDLLQSPPATQPTVDAERPFSTADLRRPFSVALALVQRQTAIAGEELARWVNGWSLVSPKPQSAAQSPGNSFATARRQQLGELLTETEKADRNKRMREADRNIAIAAATLGCSVVSNAFWPLKLLSLPGFLYLFGRNLNRTWRLIQRRKVGVPMIGTVVNVGMLSCGYFTIGSITLLIQQLADKMVANVVDDSRNKMVNIFRRSPKTVWLVLDDGEVEFPLTEVAAGQIVAVYAGEIIPVDGVVVAGLATVDQQLLTGEARPVDKGLGEPVFAATLVVAGQIQVAVEKAGEATTVAQIGALLNHTIEYKSAIQLRAEQLGDRTVIPTFIAGAAAFVLVGPMGALTLMSSHFRRVMGLFGPLSMMSFLNAASQRGTLIKDGRSLDLLSQIDTLVFDKTGTLTQEQPTVGAIYVCAGVTPVDFTLSELAEDAFSTSSRAEDATVTRSREDTVLRLAAAAEQKQTHPIARAIRTAVAERGIALPTLQEASYQQGFGLTVQIDQQTVRVGSARLMAAAGLTIPVALAQNEAQIHLRGNSSVMVACDKQVIGAIELVPTLRPEVKAVIQTLRQRHPIRSTYIISGDHTAPTRQLAEELGIDHYFAETLPEQKAALIEQLCQEGRFVCYVGDGINDAIALKKAHVSISLQGASSVAIDTAQVILVNSNLQGLPELFDFAHEFRANTNQTFAIVLGTTLVGMGGALFFHFTLIHTAVLGTFSLAAGLVNSLRPMAKYHLNAAAPMPIAPATPAGTAE